MNDRIQELVEHIRRLNAELTEELQRKAREYYYEILGRRVTFDRKVHREHRGLVKRIPRYLRDASLLNILTAPVIWACLIPAVLMDAFITLYQLICFPVYGIPRVRRGDYVVMDRHYLKYLNLVERINCTYCGYFNGVVAYAQEVAARTEQYWCPVKHARKLRVLHSRYRHFMDYGDAETYRKAVESIRRDFSDLT
jgi:hypothetical protein